MAYTYPDRNAIAYANRLQLLCSHTITIDDVQVAATQVVVQIQDCVPEGYYQAFPIVVINERFIRAAQPATSAIVTSTESEPFALMPGATLVLDIDNVGDATCTFDAAAATITDTVSYPVGNQDGKSLYLNISGYSPQLVAFVGTVTDAAHVAQQINDQTDGCIAIVESDHVKISTLLRGTDAAISVGVNTTDLTFGTPVAGSGDVADISHVSSAEVKTVIEADSTANVDLHTDGTFSLRSPTAGSSSEIDIDAASTSLASLGLSAAVTNGVAALPEVRALLHIGSPSLPNDSAYMAYNCIMNACPIGVTYSAVPDIAWQNFGYLFLGFYGGRRIDAQIYNTSGVNLSDFTQGSITIKLYGYKLPNLR